MPVNFYAVLAPLVLGLVVIEFCYCLYTKNGYYDFQDSLSSLGTAIINQCVNLFVAFLVFAPFSWIYENATIFHHNATWLTYALGFIGVDFLFYWFHRMGHSINFLWAAHMPHHSTEELNYAVALRASVTQRMASFLFYWPLLVFGISPVLLTEIVAVHLVLQFASHTRVIPRLPGFIENYFNTPSHHRVHHGLNQQYINKNYAGFLIIWDKMFGTFEPEVEEVFYGCSRQRRSWDPTKINVQWWKYLWDDCMETPYLIDKVKVWFMPLGWRPRGVKPIASAPIMTKEKQKKYQSTPYKNSYAYIIAQLFIGMGFMLFVIGNKTPLSGLEQGFMALNFWVMATVWGGLMESKLWSIPTEIFRLLALPAYLLSIKAKYDLPVWYLSTSFLITISSVSLLWLVLILSTNKSEDMSLSKAY